MHFNSQFLHCVDSSETENKYHTQWITYNVSSKLRVLQTTNAIAFTCCQSLSRVWFLCVGIGIVCWKVIIMEHENLMTLHAPQTHTPHTHTCNTASNYCWLCSTMKTHQWQWRWRQFTAAPPPTLYVATQGGIQTAPLCEQLVYSSCFGGEKPSRDSDWALGGKTGVQFLAAFLVFSRTSTSSRIQCRRGCFSWG